MRLDMPEKIRVSYSTKINSIKRREPGKKPILTLGHELPYHQRTYEVHDEPADSDRSDSLGRVAAEIAAQVAAQAAVAVVQELVDGIVAVVVAEQAEAADIVAAAEPAEAADTVAVAAAEVDLALEPRRNRNIAK